MAEAGNNKTKVTKRSSNSYPPEEWKRHRPLITQLYFEEGKTLKEVREMLEKEYNFAPTERMYKSRLHAWGLDKKKKEHEMLDLVRQGLTQGGDSKDKVFMVRGRQVTLADALHYFNRKGVKDPTTLLEPNFQLTASSNEVSSPEEYDVKTPVSSRGDMLDGGNPLDSDYDAARSPSVRSAQHLPLVVNPKSSHFAEKQISSLQQQLQIPRWEPIPKFQHSALDSTISSRQGSPAEVRYLDAILTQIKSFYAKIFAVRDLSVDSATWSATSDENLADRFYYSMYHGYASLWSSQRDRATDEFNRAFGMIERLLAEKHVAFPVYCFDLLIRYDGTNQEEPLVMLLQKIAEVASSLYGADHPLYLVASWLHKPEEKISRAWIAESTLRKLLSFFSDGIGYFHPETIALLQTFATSLLNGKHYTEAAARFHQLVDAFETTQSETSYEVCYALRSMSEAYFHAHHLNHSLQVLKLALDRSAGLPREEEREIHVRCLRGVAEIWNRIGRREMALECMQYVVDCCVDAFGPEHPFVSRARAHHKSLHDNEARIDSAMPPMVYRLGRGGAAAKMIWTTRLSPLRLQA